MKKFFTLIAAAMMVAGANAQKEWNFSNWEQKKHLRQLKQLKASLYLQVQRQV
ncbi:hypothetical protein HPS54_02250 [Prevotella sp. PCHR]|uniref:Uncharacterized protein n=1 Tax=Xylanibacter caecicola TaxID=2736294 RepID=A0ABX2AZF5_9BACT|nr:hypothetical protein [Xylanibacter caecicola]NPE24351.1 hypothetical protein [Xylanibacter caecicola]